MQSFKVGAETLRNVLSNEALQIESVDGVMDMMEDAMADHGEIERAMLGSGNQGVDDDIERELDDLIEAGKVKEKEDADLATMLDSLVISNTELTETKENEKKSKQKQEA